MKKFVFALAAVAVLAGCTTAEKSAVGGAAIGAAVGGIASGTIEGAAIGAAVGGAGGYLIGRVADRPGYCKYRERHSRRTYVDRC